MWVMLVKSVNSEKTWEEPIPIKKGNRWENISVKATEDQAEEAAKLVIDYFNSTLREWDSPRELVKIYLS